MKSDRQMPVAIIGGGFSGTILAAQLARRGIESVLIEGMGLAGKGAAYSTTEPAHLLNLRAESMSAWPDNASDFAERFAALGGERTGFAERRLFGLYVGEILGDAVKSGRTRLVEAWATGAERDGEKWSIALDNGSSVGARALVLAVGNQEPEPLVAFSQARDRFIRNPWGVEARKAVQELAATDEGALLLGTGLTMVDVVLSLDAAGHRGRIVALSRRGQIPRAHAHFDEAAVERGDIPHGNIRALWRWLRKRGAEVGWRAAVDSLRPHSHALWQSLDTEQQKRFLRHARPWWDVHRHRIAPEVARKIHAAVAEGRLEVMAGRAVSASPSEGGIDVAIRKRGAGDPRSLRFAYAFNCTGPLHSIERTKNPLLRGLLDARLVRPDQLGIGLEVDDRARAGDQIWALGPLTKGRYWEIIAVPDIREQAAAVAEDIAMELEHEPTV
ncbi:MAG TPA: FAD/NAD(P)-binding protein [Sphingomicrobium sp.]|nr:FAD/NAD(P)-binding protein [Sphingomicrobium sp.]